MIVRNSKKLSALVLTFLLLFGGTSVNGYAQSIGESSNMDKPYEMMVDTTPDLMTVNEIIKSASPLDTSEAAIDLTNNEIGPSDYDNVEDVKQLVENTVEDVNGEGGNIELDPRRLTDVLKQQQDLVEKSKTDRFIVKYKDRGENSFKEKFGDQIQDSSEIENLVPEDFNRIDKDDSKKTLLESANDFFKESISNIVSTDENKDKTELIILTDSVNPSEFAETLKENNANEDIEYIQPDFKMSMQGLEDEASEDSLDSPVDEPIDSGDNQEAVVEETLTDGAVSEEIVEEPTPTETTTEEAITEKLLIGEPMSAKTIVAVIDTGLDITHPDLEDYIYLNPDEIPDNGIDDDDNGYIDDIHGWSFPDNSGTVYDETLGLEQAHATHITGIIAGISNADDNLIPNENIAILPLKVFRNGIAYTSDIIAAIEYAERMGAKIVNCSFGSTDNNQALKEAIENSGMLFICSAGNARTDLQTTPIYPACFNLDNVISVTSTNADGGLSYFSNYSSSLVDVATLGRDISSTLPNGEYGLQSGTSMSTAVVSGVASAVLGLDNTLDSVSLKARLLNTSDRLSNLQEIVDEGRQINVSNAVNDVEQTDITQNSPASDFNVLEYHPTQDKLYQLYSNNDDTIQIAGGQAHTIALKEDGTVWAWGENDLGQCGNGYESNSESLTQVIGLNNIISVAAGSNHNLALKSDGTVWAWGDNHYGQLGIGDEGESTSNSVPTQVIGLTNVTEIAAALHSMALEEDGTVWAWGLNSDGQLGDGTSADSYIPLQVAGLTSIIKIGAGDYHSVAVKSNGTVWSWGCNIFGQLGVGTTLSIYEPVQAISLSDVISVAAGGDDTFAVESDGTVWAWGHNNYGQLGDGSTATRTTPVQICSLTNATGLSVGRYHSFAIQSNGTVYAWGYNNYGQLGDGSTTTRTTPVQIGSLYRVISVSAGCEHGVAVKSDGTVWAWGYNNYGQLGDGTTTIRNMPIQSQMYLSGSICFEKGTYAIPLPSSGNITITVSALATGAGGEVIDNANVVYNLASPYTGISINGITGVITVASGATVGSVEVVATYQELTCSTTLNLCMFNFEDADYIASIPSFGSNVIMVAAICTDSSGNMIGASNINYNLVTTYAGVSINGTTGAVSIMSTAQVGSVEILATYQDLTCGTTLNFHRFSFERADYVALIPDSGLNMTTVTAIGTDSYGNNINASQITYSLATTCAGVSVNSTTGAVTITSTAQAGSVQLIAAYQNLKCSATLTLILNVETNALLNLSTTTDTIYLIPFTVNNIDSFSGKSFTLTYDSSALEPTDLCSLTHAKETTAGIILGTGITITSVSPGTIVMTINRNILTGKEWSGVINVIKFKAKETGQTSVTAAYN